MQKESSVKKFVAPVDRINQICHMKCEICHMKGVLFLPEDHPQD